LWLFWPLNRNAARSRALSLQNQHNTGEDAMFLKCLVVAGAVVFATAASAQQSSQSHNPPAQS